MTRLYNIAFLKYKLQLRYFVKIIFFVCLAAICSCSSPDESLQGCWTVENVTFDFDERKHTPEMISQFGREESNNELVFENDSVVYVKMAAYDGDFRYEQRNDTLFFGDNGNETKMLGVYKDRRIYSEMNTAIGKMKVVYIKK